MPPKMKDDAIVAKRGVEAYRAFYAKTYHDERRSWYKSPKSVVYALTYNLTNLAWELAGLFRFTDYRHRRLLEFIINLKTLPWQGLNTDVRFSLTHLIQYSRIANKSVASPTGPSASI